MGKDHGRAVHASARRRSPITEHAGIAPARRVAWTVVRYPGVGAVVVGVALGRMGEACRRENGRQGGGDGELHYVGSLLLGASTMRRVGQYDGAPFRLGVMGIKKAAHRAA